MKNELSIVIPAYNEEKRILHSLQKISEYAKNHYSKYEIIIVDDCSQDNTKKIVSKCKDKHITYLKNTHNRGKGYSIKRGVLKAKYDTILFSDSDLATPIEEAEKMFKHLQKSDIVIASRNMKKSKRVVKQPIYRRVVGQLFPLFVNLITGLSFKDTQCGFKMFRKKAAQKIFPLLTIERWAFDVELLMIARKYHFKVKEVPVVWYDVEGSKINPIKDAYRMARDVFSIQIKNIRGKYN